MAGLEKSLAAVKGEDLAKGADGDGKKPAKGRKSSKSGSKKPVSRSRSKTSA